MTVRNWSPCFLLPLFSEREGDREKRRKLGRDRGKEGEREGGREELWVQRMSTDKTVYEMKRGK